MQERIDTIIALSHAFGSPEYVRGGGGNTSCKTDTRLWVKPSGSTLCDLRAGQLIAMDRARVRELYAVTPPATAAAREALVLEKMLAAMEPGAAGRPSVEAALHESFDAVYVVHTHPALVNGLTCAAGGRAFFESTFPDGLWVEYVDPGYTLCLRVRELMAEHRRAHGAQPALVMLENHGVFVAHDTAAGIHAAYARLLDTLRAAYARAGIATPLARGPAPDAATTKRVAALARDTLGDAAAHLRADGPFCVAEGPLTPDHIVYARSFPLAGEPDAQAVAAYRTRHGVAPAVAATPAGVFAWGATARQAELALAFAEDGAQVRQLTGAFGGVRYLDARARAFIENWEVETYRQRVSTT